jgi:hypothetical protein
MRRFSALDTREYATCTGRAGLARRFARGFLPNIRTRIFRSCLPDEIGHLPDP